MDQSLMKRKPTYTKRRLTIIFIMMTLLSVSVMTGFSKGTASDPTVYTQNGRIVMWEELPQSGTPEDYDLLTNLRFAAQKLYTASYFRGDTVGKVIANVGLGIKYTQNVHNTRYVKGDTIFAQAISSSSLKSVAEQKFYRLDTEPDETVLFRPSSSIKGENVTWADSVSKFAKEDYYNAYGVVPNELVKHCINQDTILSVADENARTKAAANSKHDEETEKDDAVTFDVPTTLVKGDDGNYTFSLTLDAAESTKYYRNEVRTLASADQNPVFYSAKVTVTIDSEWRPVTVVAEENYDIAIPVLGAMNCSSTMTETFYDYNDPDGVIPEYDYFMEHIGDDIGGGDIVGKGSPADYLAAAFAGYLDGSEDLDLEADISVGDVDLKGLSLSVNIGTMNVRAKLGELAVEYTGDRAYITLNDIKGYFSVDRFVSLMSDPTLAPLLSGLGDIDFSSLIGDDILSTVFADCEMTTENGVTCIRLPFELTDGISIDASLYIRDDGMVLERIGGTVEAFGTMIALDAKPAVLSFPKVNDTYKCLDGVLDFIPDGANTALGTTYGINGRISAFGTLIDIADMYIDRSDSADVKVDATLDVLGVRLGVKYAGGEIYATLGGTTVHAAMSDLPALLELIKTFVNTDELGMLSKLTELLPKDINGIIGTLRTLDATDSALTVGLKIAGMPTKIVVTRAGGRLDGLKLDLEIPLIGKKLKLAADLAITAPQKKDVAAPTEYVEASDLLALVERITPLIDKEGYAFDVAAELYGVPVSGTVRIAPPAKKNMPLKAELALNVDDVRLYVAFDGDKIYVDVDGKIKLSCGTDADEISALLDEIKSAIPSDGVAAVIDKAASLLSGDSALDVGAILDKIAVKSVNTLAADDRTATVVGISALGMEFAVEIGATNGAAESLALATDGICATLVLTDTSAQEIEVDANGYIPLSLIAEYVKPIADFATEAVKAKTLKLSLKAKITTASGNYIDLSSNDLTVAIGDGIAVCGTVAIFDGTDAATDIAIKLVDGTLYVKIGDVALSLDTEADIDRLLDIVGSYLPEYLRNELKNGEGAISGIKGLIGNLKKLASAKTAEDALAVLFAKHNTLTSSDSTLKALLNTVSMGMTGDELCVFANVSGISLTLVPDISGAALTGIRLTTNLAGIDVSARIGISTSPDETAVTVTDGEKAEYVPVMQFVEVANDAVGTFTKRYGDDITFELDSLDFTYAPITDENADDTAKTPDTVRVKNVDGESALKGKFTKRKAEDGSAFYTVSLEAHVTLELSSLAATGYGTLTVELYLVDNHPAPSTAYLYYREGNSGYGELVSINSDSVMQILAAVMDIIGVNEKTAEQLVGAYRQPIDVSLFKSMDIKGLDGLKTMIEQLADKLNGAKTALAEAKSAISLVKTAGSVDTLRTRIDGIKKHVDAAINALGIKKSDKKPEKGAPVNGTLFKRITDGVKLGYDPTTVWADVDNALTTGHDRDDAAHIAVVHSDNTINGIEVQNLDAKTAMVDMSAMFRSGQEVTFAAADAILAKANDSVTYADLGKIKHLLFDVMNTANLKEFEIGGGENDKIRLHVLGSDVDVDYWVKVKLYDKAEQRALGLPVKDSDPEYKTGAAVELTFNGTIGVVDYFADILPKKSSTRLYFFDNVLYLDGIKSFSNDKYALVVPFDGSNCVRSYQKYTVDEFMSMISTDMTRFLNEFVFRLVPLSSSISGQIVDAVNKPTETDDGTKTLAQIFKGYSYDGAKHAVTLGLAELASNTSLADLNVSLTGANDGDDDTFGILNNYVSGLGVSTSFAGMVDLKLDASLKAPIEYEEDGAKRIRSSGLTSSEIYDCEYYSSWGKPYTRVLKDNTYDTLAELLLGEAINNPQFA